MWAVGGGGGVYSGVATTATATRPLMLRPSPARCRSLVREPSVLASEMNRGPVGGACLWGPVVSPLLHAEAGICFWPGRIPAAEKGVGGWVGVKRGYNILGLGFDGRETYNIVFSFVCPPPPYVHVLPPWLCACHTC